MPLHDTSSYVIIDVDPASYPKDIRWIATPGTRVRVRNGMLREGAIGTIIGHARSRKADRIFDSNRERAISQKRPMIVDDYEILIDNEGPLVKFDNPEDAPLDADKKGIDWFPGQSEGCIEPLSVEAESQGPKMIPVFTADPDADGKISDQDKIAMSFTVAQWQHLTELLNDDPDDDVSESIYRTLEKYGWLS